MAKLDLITKGKNRRWGNVNNRKAVEILLEKCSRELFVLKQQTVSQMLNSSICYPSHT